MNEALRISCIKGYPVRVVRRCGDQARPDRTRAARAAAAQA
jgi:hypothetical protein